MLDERRDAIVLVGKRLKVEKTLLGMDDLAVFVDEVDWISATPEYFGTALFFAEFYNCHLDLSYFQALNSKRALSR